MLKALAAEEKHGVDLVKPLGTSMVDVPIVSNAADLSADAAHVTVYTRPAQDVLEASCAASNPGDVVWEPTGTSEPGPSDRVADVPCGTLFANARYAIRCPALVAALGTGAASVVQQKQGARIRGHVEACHHPPGSQEAGPELLQDTPTRWTGQTAAGAGKAVD